MGKNGKPWESPTVLLGFLGVEKKNCMNFHGWALGVQEGNIYFKIDQ